MISLSNDKNKNNDIDDDVEDYTVHTITSVDDEGGDDGFEVIIHDEKNQDQVGPLASSSKDVAPVLSTSKNSTMSDDYVKDVGFVDSETGYENRYIFDSENEIDADGTSDMDEAEKEKVKEQLYRIEKARSVRPFLGKRMSSGQLSTIELDDCPFPVSILSRFHLEIFIEHFLFHIFFPFTLPLLLWRHGVQVTAHQQLLPTKPIYILFSFILPGALWFAIVLFVLFPDEMAEDGVQSAELVLAFLLFAGHRCMVAVKYAFLTDGEYEWFLTTTDSKAVEAFHEHKQLVSGWWNLDDLTIETHLAAAEIRAGVDLSSVHFSTTSRSKIQRDKWKAFFKAKKYAKPHHSHRRRSLLQKSKQVTKLGSVVKQSLKKRRGTPRNGVLSTDSLIKHDSFCEIELSTSTVDAPSAANVGVDDNVPAVAPDCQCEDGTGEKTNVSFATTHENEKQTEVEDEAGDILPDNVTAQSVALALMRYCGKYGGFSRSVCFRLSLALGVVQFMIPGVVRWYSRLPFFGSHSVSTVVILCVCVNMVFFFSLLSIFFFVVMNDFNRRMLVYRRFGKMLRTDSINRCCGAVVYTSHKYPGIDTKSPNQLRAWTLTRQVLHEFGGDILKRMNWYLLGGMSVAIVLLIWLVVLWANNFNDPGALRTSMVLHLCLFDVITISSFCLACVVIGSKVNFEGENHSFLFAVKRIQLSNSEREIQKPKPELGKQSSVPGVIQENEDDCSADGDLSKMTLAEATDILKQLGNSHSDIDKLNRSERITVIKRAAAAPDGHTVLRGRLAKYSSTISAVETKTHCAESAKERAMKRVFCSAPKKMRMALLSALREEVDYVLDAGIEMFQTLDELQPLQFLGAKASVASIGTILVVMFSGIAIISKEVFLS